MSKQSKKKPVAEPKFDEGLLKNIERTFRGAGWQGQIEEVPPSQPGELGFAPRGPYAVDASKETYEVPQDHPHRNKGQLLKPSLLDEANTNVHVAPTEDLKQAGLLTPIQRTTVPVHELGHLAGMTHNAPVRVMTEGSINPARISSDAGIRKDVAAMTRAMLPNMERLSDKEARKHAVKTRLDAAFEWLTGAIEGRARPKLEEPEGKQ